MWWLTRVRGHSMAPTLPDGQLVLTRSLRLTHVVGRGDLVVLGSPVTPHEHVVKRVVGLPGEQVTFDGGRVSIDGRPLPEPYASPSVFRGTYDVPPGHYLVLGDNRDASSDARSWTDPYTPRTALRGLLTGRSVRRSMKEVEPPRGDGSEGEREEPEMQKWTRWQAWVAAVAGICAALSPLVIEMGDTATWTMVVLGVVTAAVALGSMAMAEERISAYAMVLMGVLFVGSPWVLDVASTDNDIAVTAWVIGAVTLLAGLLSLPEVEQRMHHRAIPH